ncbi:MAG: hypothetical protein ABSE49_05085 [Polyangiaceae bacterium]|jgi:hypothetical protein
MRIATGLAALGFLLVAACSSSTGDPSGASSSSSAVGGFPGCSGLYNTNPSPTGSYYATDFGCSSNPYFTDPGDTCGSAACIQSAYDEGVCSSSDSHATCQRNVNWYAVGGASYGCGARLQVTNPANGKSVVVMVLDNGPSCTVENDANYWVLDVSYPTIMYLFGSEEGWSDHAKIQATVVATTTPLGPTTGSAPPPPVDAGAGGDDAGTGTGDDAAPGSGCELAGQTYGVNTCTETQQCDGTAWVDRSSDPADCATGVEPGGACITDSGSVVPENTCTSTLQCDDGVWVDRESDPAACL